MLDKTTAKKLAKKADETTDNEGANLTKAFITPPHFQAAVVRIVGTAPYVSNAMSAKVIENIIQKQMAGSQANKGRKRDPKDFDAIYKGMLHTSREGWYGVSSSAFRKALISACRTVGFKMTIAKLSVFVEADGYDNVTGFPLTRIYGEPRRRDLPVKLADGSTDILPRPFFDKWHADVKLYWDADQFSVTDVLHLFTRVGMQVGIGAGRPDSTSSSGMGWGTFALDMSSVNVVDGYSIAPQA